MLHQIAVKRFASFTERPLTLTTPLPLNVTTAMKKGIIFAPSSLWGSMRPAVQPLFHTQRCVVSLTFNASCRTSFPHSLNNYSSFTNDAALQLRDYFLKQSSATWSVDVWRPLGALTLDVIGRVSLGCSMGALDYITTTGGKAPYLLQAAEDYVGTSDLL